MSPGVGELTQLRQRKRKLQAAGMGDGETSTRRRMVDITVRMSNEKRIHRILSETESYI